jgi:multicomponent Na+:H+ antiporter subunit C
LSTQALFVLTGTGLLAMGLLGVFVAREAVRRFLALNVAGSGVFMVLVALAYRGPDQAPDALPHALVLTGIVVAVSATALGLALVRHLGEPSDE